MADTTAQELDAIKTALDALWPLDAEARARAIAGIAGALGVQQSSASPSGVRPLLGGGPAANGAPGELGTPREFLAMKSPRTDIERITCLAYYLTYARNTPHFDTKELSELNTEAAGARFSNASYTASNATKKSGFLTAAPGGKKQITPRGEALVNALPDRQAVEAALEAMPGRPRRQSGGRRKKTAAGKGNVKK
jgi:hypothetical protein